MSKEKKLVIVESPAKIKSLRQFLGSDFEFESSFGHIRDLPSHEFGVDVEKNFEPTYKPLPEKTKVIARLKKAAKECDVVYLSPDPDREGEAIAWHIAEMLGPKITCKRVSFNSITKEAVREAVANPRDIDMALVNAQQARRLLDRLVGYSLSPLLTRKLHRGGKQSISAGRVQSVALKLVVDREKEIEAFVPKEYWTITVDLNTEKANEIFRATLYSINGKRIEKELVAGKEDITTVSNEISAAELKAALQQIDPYVVSRVEKKDRKRQPEAPFITSTLQQEASRHFRFSPSRTMEVAQGLYEGVDLGPEGTEGLITYMRTDSVRIAPEAMSQLRAYITERYGDMYLPESVRAFHVKKSAQDAHEAIRPTHVEKTPESLQHFLSRDQFNLYSLIWRRFVASQMMPAVYDTVSCDIQAGPDYLLRATGSRLKFNGFLSVYEELRDEDVEKEQEMPIPELTPEQNLHLLSIETTQSFTRPPPRFTEATLIKELEKSGIGRPSTYATIMKKISAREYTTKEQGRLKPTELGKVVTEMLETSFQEIMSIGFTASMEDSLEQVASNEKEWHSLLQEFWNKFSATLDLAKAEARPPKILTDIPCPKCQAKLQKIWFQSKYFLGCSRYPECDYSASLEETMFDKSEYKEDFNWDQPCPKCSSPMKLRFGKFGAFLGCTTYPKCKGIVNIPKKGEEENHTHPCPAEGCDGFLVQRRSRFGKPFWSCSTFPDCDVIGNTTTAIDEKFSGRPKTAYVKKPKKERAKKEKKTKAKKMSPKGFAST
jgi:DNA topoisomerase I